MLLLHQTGSVKVGEVVRYTVTYTPSEDRILPSPSSLHVRIRNTSAIPLRAAYIHGPYTIHVAAYPSTFNPNRKVEAPKREGVPEFEPNLKAGASWGARLAVPEDIRNAGSSTKQSDNARKGMTWVIEVASQIIFSQSASVSYELLIARDERSLDLGFTAITGNSQGAPGQVQDHQQGKHVRKHSANPKGVYSKAIKLVVDDTTSLWNKPQLPEAPIIEPEAQGRKSKDASPGREEQIKQKRIHLVIVTHGLHSNLGADMLYLKESIDATARQARENRRQRRRGEHERQSGKENLTHTSTAPLSGGQEDIDQQNDHGDSDDLDDDEEVIVRGFDKNVIRTERGIQYLGKRLAKHVLEMTYPDQPCLPVKKHRLPSLSPQKDKDHTGIPAHHGSSIKHPQQDQEGPRAYRFCNISFIGHSLGGLVQTYAIAYIQKHSPEFFDIIKPVNFIAMATPFLGMSNENPMYVKFALDFGLVGRTGQDLGLTWRAPTIARSGWSAMISGLGAQSQNNHKQDDPGAKPLLRILPSGPAHVVLRRFRNRTVYSNVVNDGIVPLRTSCLLFLDWRGLGKVEKARRENGLIGTVANWGFSQLTGQNTSPNPSRIGLSEEDHDGADSSAFSEDESTVPQPGNNVIHQDDEAQAAAEPGANQWLDNQKHSGNTQPTTTVSANQSGLMALWGYIRPSGKHTTKDKKMFNRSQTIAIDQDDDVDDEPQGHRSSPHHVKRPPATRGDSLLNDPSNVMGPPKTTIFESAGDLLSPPVPPQSWITDPSTRARTIFHDRVYHPEDIPPPPPRKKGSTIRSVSGDSVSSQGSVASTEEGGMRVEEKIARAYHKDLSWRKVLVRLEPDAHNNMVVRRMFANAYGWPVIKHLCDTHFADTFAAETRDEDEPAIDRAKDVSVPVKEDGEHVKGQEDIHPPIERTDSEMRESRDELTALRPNQQHRRLHTADSTRSKDSAMWDDMYFEGTTDDDDDDPDDRNAIQRFLKLPPTGRAASPSSPETPTERGTSEADIAAFLSSSPKSYDMHRGLGVSPSPRPRSSRNPDSIEAMGGSLLGPGRLSSSPPSSPSTKICDVGLRSSSSASNPSSPVARAGSGAGGVVEHVARMSASDDRN